MMAHLTSRWIWILVLACVAMLAGCATPLHSTVHELSAECGFRYRNLTQRWQAAGFLCAEAVLPLAQPRIRLLVGGTSLPQDRVAGSDYETR